jgi:pimeloyl-ACP methyl ester carboxylesterase
MLSMPATQYAEADNLNIAYQVCGSGPVDLVYVPGLYNHVEAVWDLPGFPEWMERLVRFARVITFDKRGSGMSDAVVTPPTLEQRMADVGAVMDAVGCRTAWLMGISEGGPMCMLFAATYPERTLGLVLWGGFARYCTAPDYQWGPEQEAWLQGVQVLSATWGDPAGVVPDLVGPSMRKNAAFRQAVARTCRSAFSPRTMVQMWALAVDIDVRAILSAVSVPALVLSRRGDLVVPCDHGRFLAAHLPHADFHLLEGADHLPHLMGDEALGLIEEFITGERPDGINIDRTLASVLMTDIVGSTSLAARLGDKEWRRLLDRHDDMTQREIVRFKGRVVDRAGDGMLATFDGPARAIACARALRDGVAGLDLQIRAGLHLGEVEVRGDRIGGIAVHVAARIMAAAGADEVLVSRTIKDVVAGAGVTFTPRGTHSLKGIDGSWELYAV